MPIVFGYGNAMIIQNIIKCFILVYSEMLFNKARIVSVITITYYLGDHDQVFHRCIPSFCFGNYHHTKSSYVCSPCTHNFDSSLLGCLVVHVAQGEKLENPSGCKTLYHQLANKMYYYHIYLWLQSKNLFGYLGIIDKSHEYR